MRIWDTVTLSSQVQVLSILSTTEKVLDGTLAITTAVETRHKPTQAWYKNKSYKMRGLVYWTGICCQNKSTIRLIWKFKSDFGMIRVVMLATRSRHGVVKHLVALAVSLDRDGIKFGLGDNGNLSVEVDAELRIRILGPGIHDPGHIWPDPGIML